MLYTKETCEQNFDLCPILPVLCLYQCVLQVWYPSRFTVCFWEMWWGRGRGNE